LLRRMLRENNMDIDVSSAGLGALVGHKADEYALEVLADNGIDATEHVARQIDKQMLIENELILVMEKRQQKEIESYYPFTKGRVHLMGKWGGREIEDPYMKSREKFINAYEKIEISCKEWLEKLG